jgi:hypothetical protein
VNLALDEMLRRVVSDPEFREDAGRAPREVADRVGVAQTDLLAALDGDLRALHDRGAHPLLIMQLAGVLNIDPMDRFRATIPRAEEFCTDQRP